MDFEVLEDETTIFPEVEPGNGIHQIREMMLEGTAPVSEIMKLIALEIVEVMSKMRSSTTLLKHSQKEMNDQIKGLRDLQKTLTEAEMFSKKDSLNMEGPKFKYVYMELLEMFRKSMREAKLDDELSNSVMKHFRDIASNDEERLKRELRKMEQK